MDVSLREDTINGHTRLLRKYIWKLKVPIKIKIFIWFHYRKAFLPKDNIAKRRYKGCKKCGVCDLEQSIEQFFI